MDGELYKHYHTYLDSFRELLHAEADDNSLSELHKKVEEFCNKNSNDLLVNQVFADTHYTKAMIHLHLVASIFLKTGDVVSFKRQIEDASSIIWSVPCVSELIADTSDNTQSPGIRETAMKAALCASVPFHVEPVKVYMFKNLEIIVGSRKILPASWHRKKALYIFAYLVFHSHTSVSIDSLTDIFFEDVPFEKAKSTLRQCIRTIREALQPGIPIKKQSSYLKTNGSSYILTLPEGSYVDALRLEKLIHEAKAAAKEDNDALAHSLFEPALKICAEGEFLKDNPYSWVIPLREKYIDMEINALQWMAFYYFKNRDYDTVIDYAHK
ncbi:MAG: hypothetical protein HQK88_14710, partial [Nitrospirae bacterium]|nr:hypothetical protein [Nitrospirota bacterium]